MQQLIYFMWYLLENYDSNESIKQIIDNSELYFVPCVNLMDIFIMKLVNQVEAECGEKIEEIIMG